jgi:thiol:disulfide interchange protein
MRVEWSQIAGHHRAARYCSIAMNQALKPVWVLFFALLVVVAVSLLMKARRPDEIVPWRTSYPAALEEARGGGKRAFVYFTASWCGPCQTMKHTTWADREVEAALRDFVPVKVDIDEHPDLARQYNVDGVPTFVVLDATGTVLRDWSGASPPAEFLQELKRAETRSATKPAS